VLALGLALWTAGLFARRWAYTVPLRLAGVSASLLAFAVGTASEVAHVGSGLNWSAHLDSATLVALAIWIALEAGPRRLLLYLASLIGMGGVLWELNALGVDQLQAYAVPMGLYAAAAGLLAGADTRLGASKGRLSALAWTASGVAFGLPTFVQTFGASPVGYAILLLVESFALIVVGLIARRRGLLAVSTTFVVLAGLRMVFQNPSLILPALVLASVTFFAVGVAVLIYFGTKRTRDAAEDAV
jgi:hypothetical protein